MSIETIESKTVGYKQPPAPTQFKSGKSGNPKGRPKGRANMADSIKQAANVPVHVTVGGKKHSMSSAEAMIQKTWTDAMKGDKRSINLFVHILEMTGRTDDIGAKESESRRIRLPRSFTEEEYHLLGAPALEKDRQRALAVYDAADDEDPDNDTLRPPAVRTGDKLAALKDYDAALSAYRESIGLNRATLVGDSDNAEAKANVRLGACRIAVLAYDLLLLGKFETAVELIDEALTLAPNWLWMEMVRAHAWMFLGRVDDAKAFYLQFHSDPRLPAPSWESVILRDFAELGIAGYSHPLMNEIKEHVVKSGWNAEGAFDGQAAAELWRKDIERPQQFDRYPMQPPTHSNQVPAPDEETVQPIPPLSDSLFIILHPYDMRSGDLHADHGRLDGALSVYRSNLQTIEQRIENNENDTESKERRHEVLAKISNLAFQFVLKKRNGTALECAEEAIRHEPEESRHQLNLAHVHMFLAHVTQAKQIYYQHQNDKLANGSPWKDHLFRDFAEMRKAGLKHALMDKIERELGLR
jgi:Tfp pilus assembly protein PilF